MLARWGAELQRRLSAGGGGSSDPYFSYVSSLLQLSTNLTDVKGLTWTAQGNAAISGGKLVLDGAGDGITTPANAAFNWGTGDFALEAYLRFASTSGTQYLFGVGDNFGQGNLYVAWNSGLGLLRVVMNNASVIRDRSWSPTTGVDYHVAIARVSGQLYHFVNGTALGASIADSTNVANAAAAFAIGMGNDGTAGVNGSMWGFRATKGSGRGYSASFTPPSVPYPEA